ncbi:Zinc finger, C2H2 type [Popillia japonica]|uniref:Zinc finger, C2H2 type n=1 Tax=Popillia japonica TaxID=7064 RepID=A0AAW1NKV3_POPJA
MHLNDGQQINHQNLTVQQLHHLQVQQVLDNVVRMESSVENQQNQSSNEDQLNENLIIKDEKNLQNCTKLLGAQFGLQDIKGNLMDVRTADGSIVKISAGIQEQDLAKSLGVEVVQNMYKVNVDDINQLLAYHEVFGKLQTEITPTSIVPTNNTNIQQAGNLSSNIAIVTPKTLVENDQEPMSSSITDSPPVIAATHVCDLCGKMFQFKYQLIVHRRYHTERKPFTCQVCGKAFTNAAELTRHGKCHLGGSMFTCSHTGETPFRCSYCPKAFTRKDHLVNHVRQHTGESPHKCPMCTKSFTRKEHLTNHVRQHTGESPHRCHFCSKSFTRKEHLTNHVRIHTGESPHRCEFCQKTFTRKEHLTNHLRQHTGETPHCCNVCSKPFTRKEHLINHMRSHTGERPFSCGECGKSFPLKGNLLFHQRSHNKGAAADRPFRCDLCEKDFMCKGHLVSHRRSHSGERPFACPDCGKTFVEKGNMMRHMRKHATENGQNQANGASNINSQITSNQVSISQASSTSTVQTTSANLQIPQVSQAQTLTNPVSSGNVVPPSQHLPIHQQNNHSVVVPTANGDFEVAYNNVLRIRINSMTLIFQVIFKLSGQINVGIIYELSKCV